MSPRFLDPLDVRKLGHKRWQLLAALRYDSAILGARLVVPTGFVTDFASVPRMPGAFLLTGDSAHRAAVVHDYLFQIQWPDFDAANAVFREAMEFDDQDPEPAWRRSLMYEAVRRFGWEIWSWGEEKRLELNPELVVAPAEAP